MPPIRPMSSARPGSVLLIYICQVARGKRGKKHRDGLMKRRASLWRSGGGAAGKVVTISQLAAKLTVNHAEPSLQFQRSAGPVITGNWAYRDSRWGFITTQVVHFHLLRE